MKNKTATMKTIFVFNTGSSSVKISLLSPSNNTPHHSNTLQDDESPPLRILTAHAQRIGTEQSSAQITFSSNLIKAIGLHESDDDHGSFTHDRTIENRLKKKICFNHHKDSLKLSSRSSSNIGHDIDQSVAPDVVEVKKAFMSHEVAIRTIIDEINKYDNYILKTVVCVGHRVVHGGDFSDATIVDSGIMERIQNFSHLAPLHNPANLLGIKIGQEIFKDIPQIAVFDTAFHATIPKFAHMYPIPNEYTDKMIRKYGFHGTSVNYVTKLALKKIQNIRKDQGKMMQMNESSKLVVAHLGNGASVTAVVDGKSVDTTMEFTPLSGIMMGTRSGNIDPSIVTFASTHLGKSPEEVVNDLNKHSGLLAISHGDSDMRSVEKRASSGDEDAKLAIEMFVYTLAKHIAAMIVACGGSIDALVFTAGIGEHSALVRQKVIERLGSVLGSNIVLNAAMNAKNGNGSYGIINTNIDIEKNTVILVIPTDEEIGICQECEKLLRG